MVDFAIFEQFGLIYIVNKIVKDNDPALVYSFAFSFLSTSKRVIVCCINVTQQVSINANAGIKVIWSICFTIFT